MMQQTKTRYNWLPFGQTPMSAPTPSKPLLNLFVNQQFDNFIYYIFDRFTIRIDGNIHGLRAEPGVGRFA